MFCTPPIPCSIWNLMQNWNHIKVGALKLGTIFRKQDIFQWIYLMLRFLNVSMYERSLPTQGSYKTTNQICSYALCSLSDSFKKLYLYLPWIKKNPPFLAEYLQIKHFSLRRRIFLVVYVGYFCASLPSFLPYIFPFLNIRHQSLFLDGY